ncbi:MAG: M20/M25/M40 family metallo-hydrolase [Caldisericia bacterium]|nr:M20/M25/M40 family metallo-hydrolase [Caldisericia bacterium]
MKLFTVILATIQLVFSFPSPTPIQTNTSPLQMHRLSYYQYVSSQTSAKNALATIHTLCSQDFTGRQSGTVGCEHSADWITQYMEQLHLQPCQLESPGSYLQNFSVPLVQIETPTKCLYHGNPVTEFEYRNEFYPYLKSDSGFHKSEGVFAGFGIQTSDYDDYANTDVKDKVVIVLSGQPSFLSSLPYVDHANIQQKIANAKKKGAKAVLIVNQNADSTSVNWEKKEVYDPGTILGILIGFLSLAAAEIIFQDYSLSTDMIINTIESSKKPFTFTILESLEIEITISKEEETTSNVIGFIPSQTPTLSSFLITAHYDHLGQDSINDAYYFGANDNASGVSVMLEIARTFQDIFFTTNIHIVFIAFSGEEEGLIGSKWYVEHPLFPLDEIVGVINLDMVGVGDSSLIAGTDDHFYPELCDSIQEASDTLDIPIEFTPGGLWSGSDQYYFHKNNVPCVFFWKSGTNVWETYHTPRDIPSLIIVENLQETLQICAYTTLSMIHPDFLFFPSPPLEIVHSEYYLESIHKNDFPLLSHYFGYQFET